MHEEPCGKLVIIGGAEDKEHECVILRKVVELAGKDEGRIVVMTTATEFPKEVGEEYREIFKRLGCKEIKVLNIEDRVSANDAKNAEIIEEARCVFFSGGDQLRITSILGGTLIDEALQRALQRGMVIAGTSAGASVMSKTMIVQGKDDEPAVKCTVKMAPGMGWIDEVVVDQHFAQRGRLGRLLSAVAQNPYPLGIGIDEDTAVVVYDNKVFEVIGTNSVTVVDGRSISYSNVSEAQPDEPLALADVTMHALPAGFWFDLRMRRPMLHSRKKKKEN